MPAHLTRAEYARLVRPRPVYRHPVQRAKMGKAEPRGFTLPDGSVVLYIPVLSMSGNEYIRLHGLARYRKHRDLEWFFVAAERGLEAHKQHARASLLITRVSTRALDSDNLVAGLKPFQDALVRRGWLVDDSPTWLESHVPLQLRPTGLLKLGTYFQIVYKKESNDGQNTTTTGTRGRSKSNARPGK